MEKELVINLFKAVVRPHLEYCIQALRPFRKKDIDTHEWIQRRAMPKKMWLSSPRDKEVKDQIEVEEY